MTRRAAQGVSGAGRAEEGSGVQRNDEIVMPHGQGPGRRRKRRRGQGLSGRGREGRGAGAHGAGGACGGQGRGGVVLDAIGRKGGGVVRQGMNRQGMVRPGMIRQGRGSGMLPMPGRAVQAGPWRKVRGGRCRGGMLRVVVGRRGGGGHGHQRGAMMGGCGEARTHARATARCRTHMTKGRLGQAQNQNQEEGGHDVAVLHRRSERLLVFAGAGPRPCLDAQASYPCKKPDARAVPVCGRENICVKYRSYFVVIPACPLFCPDKNCINFLQQRESVSKKYTGGTGGGAGCGWCRGPCPLPSCARYASCFR